MGAGNTLQIIEKKLLNLIPLGDFSAYLWAAYIVTIIILLGLFVSTIISNKQLKRKLKHQKITNTHASYS